jgi:2-oxo-4-hydroxy-4-carboxy-5-ureidoimidazoline decarboxylase
MLKSVTADSLTETAAQTEAAQQEAAALERWNALPAAEAAGAILPCCGSLAWARQLTACRPIVDKQALLARSDAVWVSLAREDWQQAFDSHPRLGESQAKAATQTSLTWSSHEQRNAQPSDALREANLRYEEKFGSIFLLCANGRTAVEILAALERRMHNDAEAEWQEAGEQQRQITRLRLERWLRER